MNVRIERKVRESASIPRIDIEKTVTNDIRLMLNMLMPTNDLARLIRNYETFLADLCLPKITSGRESEGLILFFEKSIVLYDKNHR